MEETEGSCKKRRKMVMDEDEDDVSLFLAPRGGRCSWGLIWVKKPEDDGTEFRIKHLLLKGGNNVDTSYLVCHLCKHPYNSELMYIRCSTCMCWFHAESVELDESKIFQLVGFSRRIRLPVCPYDETKKNRPLEKRENVTVQPSGISTLPQAVCARNALKDDATIIEVEGYSVKKEFAPMLRRIFDKHKDIARDCKIKSRSVLMANLEMICAFCHKLENKTLEDLLDVEVEDMTLVVEDFRHMGFDVEWLSKRLREFSIMKQVIDNKHALNNDKTQIEIKAKEVDMLKENLSIAEAKLATMKVEFEKKDVKISKQMEALRLKGNGFWDKSLMYGLI